MGISGHAVLQSYQGAQFFSGKDFSRVYSGIRPGFCEFPKSDSVHEPFRDARDAFFALEIPSSAKTS